MWSRASPGLRARRPAALSPSPDARSSHDVVFEHDSFTPHKDVLDVPHQVKTIASRESSSESILGATKQWLDDVFSASLRGRGGERSSSSQASSYVFTAGQEDRDKTESSTTTSSTSTDDEYDFQQQRRYVDHDDTDDDEQETLQREGRRSWYAQDSATTSGFVVGGEDPGSSASYGHFQRLSVGELMSLFALLDGDHDGIVSVHDIYGFLALHPQSIDITVATFYQSNPNHRHTSNQQRAASSHHHASQGDDCIPLVVPHNDVQLLLSCPRSHIRDADRYQRFSRHKFRRDTIPTASDVLGPTWWAQHHVYAQGVARRFVVFLLRMIHSLAHTTTHTAPASTQETHFDASSSSSTLTPLIPFFSFFSFQRLYYHTVDLMHPQQQSSSPSTTSRHPVVSAALDMVMLRRLLWFYNFGNIVQNRTGRAWTWVLSLRTIGGGECDDVTAASAVRAASESTEELPLDKAAAVHRYFMVIRKALQDGCPVTTTPLPPSPEEILVSRKSGGTEASRESSQSVTTEADTPRLISQYPPSFYTSLPAVFWTFASWHVPRGWLDVSILQRLGEAYVRRRAKQHASIMRTFLRQLWVSQPPQRHMTTSQPTTHPASQVATSTQTHSSTIGDKLALVQLSTKFLSFHRIDATAQQEVPLTNRSAAQPTEPEDEIRGLLRRTARDGIRSLWETASATSTQASPKRGPKRRLSGGEEMMLMARLHNDDVMSEVTTTAARSKRNDGEEDYFSSVAQKSAPRAAVTPSRDVPDVGSCSVGASVVRQSLLSHDLTLHSALTPPTLSAVPSLSANDRSWLSHATRQCIIRAALYALFSAVLIAFIDVAAQSYILGSSASIFQLNEFSQMKSDALAYFGFRQLTDGTTATAEGGDGNNSSSEVSLSTMINYQIVVFVGTLVISMIEIVSLYIDTLQLCYRIAKACGIPLEAGRKEGAISKQSAMMGIMASMAIAGGGHGSTSSTMHRPYDNSSTSSAVVEPTSSSLLGEDNGELRSIRQYLVRQRVRYLIAAVTRCALQIQHESATVLGVDVRDRSISRGRVVLELMAARLKRVGPSIVLRLVTSRLISPVLVPFVGIPLLVVWNVLLTSGSCHRARLVALGSICVERLAHDLLSSAWSPSLRIAEHNHRPASAPSTTRSSSSHIGIDPASSRVHVPSHRPLYHVSYHCLREMVRLVAFYSHMVQEDTGVMHPTVHCLLVELLCSCEAPDVALWMVPLARTRKHQQSNPRSTHSSAHKPSTGAAAASSSSHVIHAETERASRNKNKRVRTVLEATPLDVAGTTECVLSAEMASFTQELNRLRVAVRETTSSAPWMQLYVEQCPWPFEVSQRIVDQDHIRWLSIVRPQHVDDIRFTFLLESCFPSWAASSAMGPQDNVSQQPTTTSPSSQWLEDADGDRDSEEYSVILDHAAADLNLRSATHSSPFSLAHVKAFLTLSIMLALVTTVPLYSNVFKATKGPSGNRRIRRFLLKVHQAYAAAWRNHHHHTTTTTTPQNVSYSLSQTLEHEAAFLEQVDALHASYWCGAPVLTVAKIHYIIDISLPRTGCA